MKKVILSIALATGIFAVTTVQATNASINKANIEVAFEDDGFVDVKFEELNEKVQEAVRVVAEEYDLNALQYNAEKQLTKVVGTKKDDQSKKTFYFDVEGKEVVVAEAPEQEQVEEQTQETTETETEEVKQEEQTTEEVL